MHTDAVAAVKIIIVQGIRNQPLNYSNRSVSFHSNLIN
jgi:hypothetical protein